MNRRAPIKEEAKCNFCHNWFQLHSDVKIGLNLCEACIQKGLNTSSFKFVAPQGHLYQIYLARRHVAIEGSTQSALMDKIDEFMHAQIREVIEKWDQIAKMLKSFHPHHLHEEVISRMYPILDDDAKIFTSCTYETTEKLRMDVLEKVRKDRKKAAGTPLRQRSNNTPTKTLNKSASKIFNRSESKISIKPTKQATQKCLSRTMHDQQNNFKQEARRSLTPVSPNNLRRDNSTKKLVYDHRENRQFIMRVQNIKSNIGQCLEDIQSQNQQSLIPVPHKIMKQRIFDVIEHTNIGNKSIELVAYPGLQAVNIKCYLSNLDWDGVEVLKMVKVGLTDWQLEEILEFIHSKSVETLVLTSNNLTEQSCQLLLGWEIKSLKNIYMGKNQIFPHKLKNELRQLRAKYNFYL